MNIPRLRIFAGPNGSGKSTLKSVISDELLGIYINPDEIEKEINEKDFLDLEYYQISTNNEELRTFFTNQ
jgi:predicted ABC-type ATPase